MLRPTHLLVAATLFCLSIASLVFAAETKVMFAGSSGASIRGTVLVPEAKAGVKCPAVVLLAGSGPTDRDGNQPPAIITDLLKQIAEGLSKQGIASLRFDKRGMHANAADMPKNMKAVGEFMAWESFAGDAALAYEFLRTYDGIDSSRVGILGHSEGGVLALEAARILGEKQLAPAVLILLGTPGRPMDAILEDQLHTILEKQKASPVAIGYLVAEHRRIAAAIHETSTVPDNVPAGLAGLYPKYLGQFLHGDFAAEPAKLAKLFAGPVLVMNGGADVQISPEKDAKAIEAALKERSADDHAFFVIPNASHNLKPLKSADDPGFTGEMDAMALREVLNWASTKLLGKPVEK